MLKIVNIPNDVLTRPSRRVRKIDEKIKRLLHEMEETLNAQLDPQGVGLAASQVGVDLAIFLMKPTEDSPIRVFINPKILTVEKIKKEKTKKKSASSSLEGCLSIPRIWAPIERSERVQLEYQTSEGEKKTEWFNDFEAVIVQHEMDHLQGILFTQRAIEQHASIYEEKSGQLKKTRV